MGRGGGGKPERRRQLAQAERVIGFVLPGSEVGLAQSLDRAGEQERLDRRDDQRRLEAPHEQLVDAGLEIDRRRQRRADVARDGLAQLVPPGGEADPSPGQGRDRLGGVLDRRGPPQPQEHHRQRVERVPLGPIREVALGPERPGPIGPAERAGDAIARLRGQVLDQIRRAHGPLLDQRLADLFPLVVGALQRHLVLLLGDRAARDQEVPQHLVPLVRRHRDRVPQEEVDPLLDPAATDLQHAGGPLVVEVEQQPGQRRLLELAGARRGRRRLVGRVGLDGDAVHRPVPRGLQLPVERAHQVLDLVGLGVEAGAEFLAQPVADAGVAIHAAHYHQVHVRVALADRLAEAKPVHPRHEQVGHHELGLLGVEHPEALLAVARLHHLQGVLLQVLVDDPFQQRPGVLVVVDDEDGGH